ncbi:MAG: hypothetical protein KJ698_05365 [Actinobacteria bacterium]|nr:hypothetical protein [Actinomycetota bacterium]MBU1493141.1 hypothetical protein [Actinomycetota bacterium]MBU1866610.1 hypothetical protein [Actinomycetota bacterium]
MDERREGGFALVAVILGIGAMVFIVALLFQQAASEYDSAQHQRREDSLVAGAEAMLERYASKLTIDPVYYQHWVDEAELPRRCTDGSSLHYYTVADPGTEWFSDCATWDYQDPAAYFAHPMLVGDEANTADDTVALLTVAPPTSSSDLRVTIVARNEVFNHSRAIEADIRPEAISEFAFMTMEDQNFGSGAHTYGKVYSGDDINYQSGGYAHRNIYAEDGIGVDSGYGPPTLVDGAKAYDGRPGGYPDIRAVFPEPINFDNFWDDLGLIHTVACERGGLCLSRSGNPGLGLSSTPPAWLIEPQLSGSSMNLRVSISYSNSSTSCLTSEEWWWVNSGTASWTYLGTYPLPANGIVWVDGHAVIGKPGQTSTIRGAMTLYAGRNGSPKNIILASDIVYAGGTTGSDVLGLISSDWVIINPYAIGSDRVLNLSGAMLEQGGTMWVARSCGYDGNDVVSQGSGYPTLNTFGSQARRQTGNMSAQFAVRNYTFDTRLERLRPPLFPLLGDSWSYGNWKEIRPPCWARPDSSNCP